MPANIAGISAVNFRFQKDQKLSERKLHSSCGIRRDWFRFAKNLEEKDKMLSKLAKNAIIKGPLEHFCVVCECRLDSSEKIHAHLEDGTHEKKLASYPHLEKYDGDHIRKIKSMYFCEFCSVVLHTANKVNVHVTTKEHRDNKGAHQLRPGPNNGVLAFDDVFINENAWHSVKDECCAICGVEFEQAVKHKKEPSHLLRLAEVKIEFVENGLFRKVDELTFQCLTCDHEYDINIFNDHFESNSHSEAFSNSKLNNSIKLDDAEATSTKKDEKEEKGARPKDVAIDTKEEMRRYAKDNHITYNATHLNAYCRLCEIRMPSTLNSLKEHVNGSKHVNKLRALKPRLTKQPIGIFIHDLSTIQNVFHQDIVINHRICVPLISFAMVSKTPERMRCQACEVNLNEDYIFEHLKIPKHARFMDQCPVVTTFDGEFLREIRPGTFHCGYCNILIPKWEEVEGHLDTADHKYKKGACNHRLQSYLPEMAEDDDRQKLAMFFRMMMRGRLIRCWSETQPSWQAAQLVAIDSGVSLSQNYSRLLVKRKRPSKIL